MVDDDQGYTWLTGPDGDRIHLAEVHTPGDVTPMGQRRIRQRRGDPPAVSYDELPADHHDPVARVELKDGQGIDEALVFPNFGLFWVRTLEAQPDAQRANMEAWNRWAREGIGPAGGGRLHPVGHVTLRHPAWLERELTWLADAGVTTAMVPIGPVDGRPFSHRDLDACWSMFEDHDMAVAFHIADGPRPFADAWYEDDVNQVEPMLMSTFISVTPMLALTDLAVGGVLDRHPRLRVGLIEFTSSWLAPFLAAIDGSHRFHGRYNGLAPDRLELRPSEYLRRQVRVATFGFECAAPMASAVGDLTMFGSDYPHAEGLAHPLEDFRTSGGPAPSPDTRGLYHQNAAWVLGREGA
jgi:predicted TIM-barrel fold metal-dependent hydrolase